MVDCLVGVFDVIVPTGKELIGHNVAILGVVVDRIAVVPIVVVVHAIESAVGDGVRVVPVVDTGVEDDAGICASSDQTVLNHILDVGALRVRPGEDLMAELVFSVVLRRPIPVVDPLLSISIVLVVENIIVDYSV